MARTEFEAQGPRFDVIKDAILSGRDVKQIAVKGENLRVGSAVNDEFCALPNVSMFPGPEHFVNSDGTIRGVRFFMEMKYNDDSYNRYVANTQSDTEWSSEPYESLQV